jgi:hypothetical protein
MTDDHNQDVVLPGETELPMSTRKSTRSGREFFSPQHLRDFVLLSKLSKQTYFAPSRQLPRVRCEVLNDQRLSTLRWDNLLTSLRSGSYGSLLSFVQQHSEDGYLDEWHPSLLATKANAEDKGRRHEWPLFPRIQKGLPIGNFNWK